MARPIDKNNILERIGSLIDFRCGKCGPYTQVRAVYQSRITGEKGIEFQCHGEVEFLEISEAMLNYPRRLKGYRPFLKLSPTKMTSVSDKVVRGDLIVDAQQAQRDSRPMCSRCQRPVDGFKIYSDDYRRNIVCQFRCHGAIEELPFSEKRATEPGFYEMLRTLRPFSTDPTGVGGPTAATERPGPGRKDLMKGLLELEVAIGKNLTMPTFPITIPPPSVQDLLELFYKGKITANQFADQLATTYIDGRVDQSSPDASIDFTALGLYDTIPPKPKPTAETLLLPEAKPRMIELED